MVIWRLLLVESCCVSLVYLLDASDGLSFIYNLLYMPACIYFLLIESLAVGLKLGVPGLVQTWSLDVYAQMTVVRPHHHQS
jgi:hypothetical protein